MNPNNLMYKVKKEIGLGTYLKTSYSDKELYNIIVNISLPTFSKYFKHVLRLETAQLKPTDRNDIFELPLSDDLKDYMKFFGVNIKGVRYIEKSTLRRNLTGNVGALTMFPHHAHGFAKYDMEHTVLMATMQEKIEMSDFGISCEFIEPYYVRFINQHIRHDHIYFDVELYTSHPSNLSTIGTDIGSNFRALVKLDIKRILWNNEFKYINGLETTFSSIDLKIDDWAEAEERRGELIADFKEHAVIGNPLIVF